MSHWETDDSELKCFRVLESKSVRKKKVQFKVFNYTSALSDCDFTLITANYTFPSIKNRIRITLSGQFVDTNKVMWLSVALNTQNIAQKEDLMTQTHRHILLLVILFSRCEAKDHCSTCVSTFVKEETTGYF